MGKENKTGAGSEAPGQPSGVAAPEKGAGAPPGTQAEEPVAAFDFSTVPEDAWKSDAWYEHVPEDAVSLDKFPQFGEYQQTYQRRDTEQARRISELEAEVQGLHGLIEFQEMEGLSPEEQQAYQLQKLQEMQAGRTQADQEDAGWDELWDYMLDLRDGYARVLGLKNPEEIKINEGLFYENPEQVVAEIEQQARTKAQEIASPVTSAPIVESHAGGAPGGGLIEEVAGKPPRERQKAYANPRTFERLLKEAGSKK